MVRKTSSGKAKAKRKIHIRNPFVNALDEEDREENVKITAREQSRAGSVSEIRGEGFEGYHKTKMTDDSLIRKTERLHGLEAIYDTWMQHDYASIDPEYVQNLRVRIGQAEVRLRNGL